MPLKAHAPHEPVIPKETGTVLVVIGIDGLGNPIKEAAHRPALYASLVHADVDTAVTAKMIRDVVLTYPRCDGVVINKAEDAEQQNKALQLADLFDVPVAITAWQTNDPIKAFRRKEV